MFEKDEIGRGRANQEIDLRAAETGTSHRSPLLLKLLIGRVFLGPSPRPGFANDRANHQKKLDAVAMPPKHSTSTRISTRIRRRPVV
ncbi:hypothetical protein [Bradyrhizobium centrolobii]|nr:hypothetical protein [Bradyrhizobium centrolobii]